MNDKLIYLAVKEDKLEELTKYGFIYKGNNNNSKIYALYEDGKDTYDNGFQIIVNPIGKDFDNYPKNAITINYYFNEKADIVEGDWIIIDADSTKVATIITKLWEDGIIEKVEIE